MSYFLGSLGTLPGDLFWKAIFSFTAFSLEIKGFIPGCWSISKRKIPFGTVTIKSLLHLLSSKVFYDRAASIQRRKCVNVTIPKFR